MSKFLVTNRRAGLFTDATKHASRASVATTLSALGSSAKVLSDHAPPDPLARRVVVVEADAGHVAALRASLGPHALIEPLVYHHLHDHRRPAFLRRAVPLAAHALRGDHRFGVTVTGHGQPLAGADVLVYVANAFGNISNTTIKADAHGHVSVKVPARRRIVAVEPIPYASCWIMLADAPVDGATIDCPAIPKATASGSGWWHEIMGVDTGAGNRGKGIAVGVIDTGCGPHANLAHVNLVGAFVDGDVQLGAAHGTDVAEHGTHTTGIIGARPTRAGDFAGMAPDCTLFHARVFKSEDEGPSSADLINAIDSLSRNHGCDLINMSLGGGGPTQAEEDAIRDAAERGTLCICSAGNETAAIEFPGAYPECAAVSAVGMLGTVPAGSFSAGNRPQDPEKIGTDNLFLAAFSCFADGPGQALACCAPGVGIISTVPDKGDLRDLYMEMDGTSMASPAACGALAVILGQSDDYKALPRDVTRSDAARLLLRQHCRSIGLDPQFEGAGLPQV